MPEQISSTPVDGPAQDVRVSLFAILVGRLNPAAIAEGGFESTWSILVTEEQAGLVLSRAAWFRVEPQSDGPLWTDDFSSLLGVLKF